MRRPRLQGGDDAGIACQPGIGRIAQADGDVAQPAFMADAANCAALQALVEFLLGPGEQLDQRCLVQAIAHIEGRPAAYMSPEDTDVAKVRADELREEVARVIDPFNWEERSSYYDRADQWFEKLGVEDHALVGGYRAKAEEIVAPSLAKADALIAAGLVRSPIVGEGVERVARAVELELRDAEPAFYDGAIRTGVRAALAAMPDRRALLGEVETTYEVWQDDMMVASADSETDGRHYLAMYAQDGPAVLKRAVTTRAILHEIEGTKL